MCFVLLCTAFCSDFESLASSANARGFIVAEYASVKALMQKGDIYIYKMVNSYYCLLKSQK